MSSAEPSFLSMGSQDDQNTPEREGAFSLRSSKLSLLSSLVCYTQRRLMAGTEVLGPALSALYMCINKHAYMCVATTLQARSHMRRTVSSIVRRFC